MARTVALSALVLALAGACTGSAEEEDLILEADGGKEDAARPFGRFERTLAQDDYGFTLLALHEDRTYQASQELVRCEPGACTDTLEGTYRFASSNGNKYIVLYEDGDWAYSFEYKLSGEDLSLRYTGTSGWFTMQKARALTLDESDHGGTFDVPEGDDVVVRLPANATTGYKWIVAATDRTFGYPAESYEADGGAVGSGGTSVFTWKTSGGLPVVGSHSVTLEYRRPWETSVPAEETFQFTVNVTP